MNRPGKFPASAGRIETATCVVPFRSYLRTRHQRKTRWRRARSAPAGRRISQAAEQEVVKHEARMTEIEQELLLRERTRLEQNRLEEATHMKEMLLARESEDRERWISRYLHFPFVISK